MNLSHLCAQNTHIGYLSWTGVFGKKPDLSLEHESLVKNAAIHMRVWCPGLTPPSVLLYLALSFLAKAEKPQDKFYHLVNLSLEKANGFSRIIQQLQYILIRCIPHNHIFFFSILSFRGEKETKKEKQTNNKKNLNKIPTQCYSL
mgnify:CR=1 FL=1